MSQDSKIQGIQNSIDSVKNTMVMNIDKMLEREQQMSLLMNKTESLSHDAFRFRNSSKDYSYKQWWSNAKTKIIFGVIFVVAILILIFIIIALKN